MRVESDLAPKRKFIPDDLFYKCTNPQKICRSASICFKSLNRANQLIFQTGKFSSIKLNVYPSLKFNILFDLGS
jgi:hypothetical protein